MPWNSSKTLSKGSRNRTSSWTRRSCELVLGALLDLDPGLLEVLARLLERGVVGELPADAVELVDVGGEDDEPGGDLVDPPVLVVGVRAATLGQAEHLAGERLPLLEVGGGDADIAHGLDVDGHGLRSLHVAGEEVGGDLGELVGGLDLCPVPAVREDMQAGARDRLERDHRAVERVDAVLAAPGEQGVLADLVGVAPEHAVLGGVLVEEGHAHRDHRLARAGRGGVGVPLLDQLVGDEVLVDHHRRDERAERLAAGRQVELGEPLDALGGVGVEQVEREPARAHQDEPADPVGVLDGQAGRRTAAEAVAEQVHPLDAELVEQRDDVLHREAEVVADHRRLVGAAEARLVDQQGAEGAREPGQGRAEVRPRGRAGAAAVQHQQRQVAADPGRAARARPRSS